ncbi:MAG TPA: hypothetical protein VD969_23270 [Symbiobacteriaceae bacterium]|nr:hypothetical protein [Symbiobacteriaceae bacterium]
MHHDFTAHEVSEIELARELCSGMLVDGQPVICFDILYEVIQGTKRMDDLPSQLLVTVYSQLKDYNRFWQEAPWYDNTALEAVLPKLRLLVHSELTRRRS